jgi:hypothetical protein
MYLEDELTIKNCSKIFHLPEIRIRWFAIRTNASENLLTEATKNVRMLSEHVYGICKKAGGLFVDESEKNIRENNRMHQLCHVPQPKGSSPRHEE